MPITPRTIYHHTETEAVRREYTAAAVDAKRDEMDTHGLHDGESLGYENNVTLQALIMQLGDLASYVAGCRCCLCCRCGSPCCCCCCC